MKTKLDSSRELAAILLSLPCLFCFGCSASTSTAGTTDSGATTDAPEVEPRAGIVNDVPVEAERDSQRASKPEAISIGDSLADSISRVERYGGQYMPIQMTHEENGKNVPYLPKHTYRFSETIGVYLNIRADDADTVKSIGIWRNDKRKPEFRGDGESIEPTSVFDFAEHNLQVTQAQPAAVSEDGEAIDRIGKWEDRIGDTVTLMGRAENHKIGAFLDGDGFGIYIDLPNTHWPDELYSGGDDGEIVLVTGTLAQRSDLPVFVPDPKKPSRQGMPVPVGTDLDEARKRYILESVKWGRVGNATERNH